MIRVSWWKHRGGVCVWCGRRCVRSQYCLEQTQLVEATKIADTVSKLVETQRRGSKVCVHVSRDLLCANCVK